MTRSPETPGRPRTSARLRLALISASRQGITWIAGALHRLSSRTILWIGFAVFLVYAFPGYMSNDSVVQLIEGRTRQFTNPHPPIMAAEWGVLDSIISGPVLMLVLQGAAFLLGCAAVLRRSLPPRAAAIAAIAVLLFPPVTTTMAVIWKDSQMAAYLVAGTALLLGLRRSTRLVGLVLVTAGCAFRLNAFAAAVPLVFALFEWRPGLRWFQRYAISLVASVAMMLTASAVNRALTVETTTLTPAYVDIVGVLTFTRDRSDDELRALLRDTPLRPTTDIQAHARKVFSPRNAWLVDHGDDRVFDRAKTDVQADAVTRAWKTLVADDPGAYLAYRIAVFRELIGLTPSDPWSPVFNLFIETADEENWIDHNATWSPAQRQLASAYYWLVYNTPLFRPYVYIAIALVLLALFCRDRLSFALLGSGLTYELSYFPGAATADFRYSHWMIACTCLCIVLLFAQRARRARVAAT